MASVVHCKRAPAGSFVYVGRPTPFGNPFVMHTEAERESVIIQYREWFLTKVTHDAEFREAVLALQGQDLACWCAPKACHADVILKWLEGVNHG